jgi:hypothetical protein
VPWRRRPPSCAFPTQIWYTLPQFSRYEALHINPAADGCAHFFMCLGSQARGLDDLFVEIVTNPAEWTDSGLLKIKRRIDPDGSQHKCTVGCSPNMCKGECDLGSNMTMRLKVVIPKGMSLMRSLLVLGPHMIVSFTLAMGRTISAPSCA